MATQALPTVRSQSSLYTQFRPFAANEILSNQSQANSVSDVHGADVTTNSANPTTFRQDPHNAIEDSKTHDHGGWSKKTTVLCLLGSAIAIVIAIGLGVGLGLGLSSRKRAVDTSICLAAAPQSQGKTITTVTTTAIQSSDSMTTMSTTTIASCPEPSSLSSSQEKKIVWVASNQAKAVSFSTNGLAVDNSSDSSIVITFIINVVDNYQGGQLKCLECGSNNSSVYLSIDGGTSHFDGDYIQMGSGSIYWGSTSGVWNLYPLGYLILWEWHNAQLVLCQDSEGYIRVYRDAQQDCVQGFFYLADN